MEKSSSKVTVISIILALICLGILGGIIYFKVHKNDEPKKEKTEEVEKIPEKEKPSEEPEEVVEEREEDKKLAEELYLIIGNNPEFRDVEPVNFESLSENVRDEIVLNNLSENCMEETKYNKDIFLNKYKEIFNKEKESEDGYCKLNGNDYECTRYCSEFVEKVFGEFEKYEIVDDNIIIYEKVGHLYYADDGKVYLKESPIDDDAIASFDSVEELKNSEVQYKLPTYKHIFAKSEDKYYWVSSESVKQ